MSRPVLYREYSRWSRQQCYRFSVLDLSQGQVCAVKPSYDSFTLQLYCGSTFWGFFQDRKDESCEGSSAWWDNIVSETFLEEVRQGNFRMSLRSLLQIRWYTESESGNVWTGTGKFDLNTLRVDVENFESAKKTSRIQNTRIRPCPDTNPGTLKSHTWNWRQHEVGVVYLVWIDPFTRIRYFDLHLLFTCIC